MHPREIARRSAEASTRINEAAATIGDRLGLDQPPFGTISPRRGGPEVARLHEHEMQADYLEAIAKKLTSPPRRKRADAVQEIPNGPAQGDEAQGAEVETEATATEQPTGDAEPIGEVALVGGGLPAPVVGDGD